MSSTRAVAALSLSVLLFKNTGDPFFKQNLSQRPGYKLMGEKLSPFRPCVYTYSSQGPLDHLWGTLRTHGSDGKPLA